VSQLAEVKKQFFDRLTVKKALDRKTLKVLNSFGGTVRKTAQYSMRSRKGPSKAGEPPHAHGKKLLRKLLFYSLDPKSKSVIIGPILKPTTEKLHIPRTHEIGGSIKQKHYPPRPYMKPAFAKHVGKVAALYKSKV
jgi:hypothetical protein